MRPRQQRQGGKLQTYVFAIKMTWMKAMELPVDLVAVNCNENGDEIAKGVWNKGCLGNLNKKPSFYTSKLEEKRNIYRMDSCRSESENKNYTWDYGKKFCGLSQDSFVEGMKLS
ncbi:hypothetical protein PIB30_010302 [Stylosanthes scabra]|uniref:Uncharacterized protein n=1 Tax=Stylosanthes scabra TaxID=79078 RepID=A0ABU6U462_9FABA|nr:hypothetical protein [Stylosanthes scabra]